MPTPVQSNQPSNVSPSFLGRLFAPKAPKRKSVPGITYSVAESQPEAKPTRSVPAIPEPHQPMRSSLLGLVKNTDTIVRSTAQSSSKAVERTVDEIQEKENHREIETPSSFNGYTLAATGAAIAGFAAQYARGNKGVALMRTLPAILSIFSQAAGAVGQAHMGKIQAEEIQDTYDLGVLRDKLDCAQTSLSSIMEGLTKSLERYMEMAQQQAALIRQLNARGF